MNYTSIRDLFIIDFYERLTQNTTILDIGGVIKLSKNVYPDEVCCLEQKIEKSEYDSSDDINVETFDEGMSLFLDHSYPEISRILELGKGKISICGISILPPTPCTMNLELYFHSCTILEATELLQESIKILEGDVNYWIEDNYLCFNLCFLRRACFCLTVYEDRGSLLRNIGPAPDRHGWNPINGYFGTISGAISVMMKAYPIDLNFQNKDLSHYDKFGARILLHGHKHVYYGNNIRVSRFNIEYTGKYGWNKVLFSKDPLPIKAVNLEQLQLVLHEDKYTKSINPRTLLPNYIPYQTGIDDDTYVVLANIREQYNIGGDLFTMLCEHYLRAIYLDAKDRLLAGNY